MTSPQPWTTTAVLATAVVVIAVLLLLPTAADAHTGADPTVHVVLDPLPAELDGVTVQVADRLAFQLVVANPTGRALEVLSHDERPFLRIGPDGVEANLSVAEWYATNDPFGGTRVPDELSATDDFVLVSPEPSWGWYDHRLHPGPIAVPDQLVAAGEPADFGSWTVPLRVDGDRVDLTGRYRYQPLRGGYRAAVTAGPDAETVTVVVLDGPVPGLFLDNTGDDVVVVEGVDGEPFLRFDPAVGVEANLRSRSWLDSSRAADGTAPDGPVDPDAPPEWTVVSQAPRLGWIEPRTTLDDPEPDEDVVRAGVPAVVREWAIPITVGGTDQEVRGTTTWVPLAEAGPAPTGVSEAVVRWAAVAVVGVAAVGGLVATRRRAATDD